MKKLIVWVFIVVSYLIVKFSVVSSSFVNPAGGQDLKDVIITTFIISISVIMIIWFIRTKIRNAKDIEYIHREYLQREEAAKNHESEYYTQEVIKALISDIRYIMYQKQKEILPRDSATFSSRRH
jgi:hypothetical protein